MSWLVANLLGLFFGYLAGEALVDAERRRRR